MPCFAISNRRVISDQTRRKKSLSSANAVWKWHCSCKSSRHCIIIHPSIHPFINLFISLSLFVCLSAALLSTGVQLTALVLQHQHQQQHRHTVRALDVSRHLLPPLLPSLLYKGRRSVNFYTVIHSVRTPMYAYAATRTLVDASTRNP